MKKYTLCIQFYSETSKKYFFSPEFFQGFCLIFLWANDKFKIKLNKIIQINLYKKRICPLRKEEDLPRSNNPLLPLPKIHIQPTKTITHLNPPPVPTKLPLPNPIPLPIPYPLPTLTPKPLPLPTSFHNLYLLA